MLKQCKKKQQRIETRKNCTERYTWDISANAWQDYFDQVDLSKNLDWNIPPMIKPIPKEPIKNLSNIQFCEWVYSAMIQDGYNMFNHKMLSHLRNLNFGAVIDGGNLSPCTQETVFEECRNISEKRFALDQLRCSNTPLELQHDFIKQAHKGLRK